MKIPRVIAHPVMGLFIIILLATIAAIPPVYLLVSPDAAHVVSFSGMTIAMMFAVICVVKDAFLSSKNPR